MSHRLHKAWLKVSAVVVASFGPVLALGSMPGTAEPARFALDLLNWPLDGSATFAAPDTRFLSAVSGGFLMGWGVTLWMLASHAYDQAPEGVRRSAMAGYLAWFLTDSAGSIATGAAPNVIGNVIVLLIGVGPLWRPAREERP